MNKRIKYHELSESDIENIIIKFKDNSNTVKSIRDHFNISDRTLYRIIDNYSIPKRNKIVEEQTYIDAIKYHMDGNKMTDTCKKFNVSQASIHKYMTQNNIVYFSNKGRKRKFNQDYFSKIDTQDKAYWFGFLYADGSLTKSNSYDKEPNRLQINISFKDIQLLENFLTDIDSENIKIETYQPNESTFGKNKMSRITLNSIKICSDMLNNGFRKKSMLASNTVFDYIPKKLYRHFIRGYFDGDGSINIDGKITFSGTKDFLIKIDSILKENNIIKQSYLYTYSDHRKDKSHNLAISMVGLHKENMFNYMYKNATRYLERKYNRFLK